MVLEINDLLVSSEIFKNNFVCDLNACKGECCVAGDAGAPIEKNEIDELQKVVPQVKKYMTPKGVEQIEKDGVFVLDYELDYVTPLINGNQECAFVYFDKHKIAKCAIEAAFNAGEINFQKPISCHLYPIRLSKISKQTVLNYDRWHVCKPACSCGDSLNVPVYKFLKAPLIRKFGVDFFSQLEIAAEEIDKL